MPDSFTITIPIPNLDSFSLNLSLLFLASLTLSILIFSSSNSAIPQHKIIDEPPFSTAQRPRSNSNIISPPSTTPTKNTPPEPKWHILHIINQVSSSNSKFTR